MTTVEDLHARLARVPLFSLVHDTDLWVIARHCELRAAPAGATLIRAGEPGSEFFVLLSGTARRGHGDAAHDLAPGDCFGELALLDPAPRSLDVVATDDSLIAVLSHTSFRLVLDAVPGVALQMLAVLARRLRALEIEEERRAASE